MERTVTYRVQVGARQFDVTIEDRGGTLVAAVTSPATGGPDAHGQAVGGGEDKARRAATGHSGGPPAPVADAERWSVAWERRGPHAYRLALAAAASAPGAASGDASVVEVLVSTVAATAESGAADATGYRVALGGYQDEALVQEARALRLAALPRRGATAVRLELRAPMPGRVVSIRVAEGDLVERGDLVATLEAMKMENELRAPGAGRVQAIRVQAGDTVEHGALLLVLAPPEAPDLE